MTITKPAVTQLDIVRAATNDPALAKDTATLGDRTFPLVDLPYDDYIRFLALLQPLLETLTSQLARTAGIGTGLASILSPNALVKYCAESLPEMVCIICEQTDPTITVSEVKRLGKTPFALATIVLLQVQQNRIIADITDFFVQILPFLNMGKRKVSPPPKTQSTTEETPSLS